MSFVILETRDQLKKHIKQWDNVPLRYIITEDPKICVYSEGNDTQTEYIKYFLKYDQYDPTNPIMWLGIDNTTTTELIHIKGTGKITIKHGIYTDYLIEKEKITIKTKKEQIITDRLLKEKIIREQVNDEQLLKDKALKKEFNV